MIERTLWHPVADGASVRSAPLPARLLGEDLVLWRDAAGTVHAWPDRCPHRGARLSLGRVEGDRLVSVRELHANEEISPLGEVRIESFEAFPCVCLVIVEEVDACEAPRPPKRCE